MERVLPVYVFKDTVDTGLQQCNAMHEYYLEWFGGVTLPVLDYVPQTKRERERVFIRHNGSLSERDNARQHWRPNNKTITKPYTRNMGVGKVQGWDLGKQNEKYGKEDSCHTPHTLTFL